MKTEDRGIGDGLLKTEGGSATLNREGLKYSLGVRDFIARIGKTESHCIGSIALRSI